MNEPIIWGIGGLLIGFIIEYLVDLFFWRNKIRTFKSNSDHFESLLSDQKSEIKYLRDQMSTYEKSIDEFESYIKTLEFELDSNRIELEELRVQREAAEARARQYQKDSVAMRKKLHAKISAEDVQLNEEIKNKMARYKKALYDAIVENKQLNKQLQAAQAHPQITNGNGNALHNETYKSLEAPTDKEVVKVELTTDRLEEIKGIGPVYAKKLNAAGVYSFADLANMRAERLTDIIKPNRWQLIEPERWISEAATFANAGGKRL